MKILLLIVILSLSVCNKSDQNIPFFPAKYPGNPNAIVDTKKIILSNEALFAEWELQHDVISLKTIVNKYDNKTVDLSQIILFAIELENGKRVDSYSIECRVDGKWVEVFSGKKIGSKRIILEGRTSAKDIKFPIHAWYKSRTLCPGTPILWEAGYRALASEMTHPRLQFLDFKIDTVINHSVEHLVISTKNQDLLSAGDIAYAVPYHICPTMALHEKVDVVSDSKVIDIREVVARKRGYNL